MGRSAGPADDYAAPVSVTRYRCAACGNLTRFDVTSTRTTRAFNHFTVGGELEIEEEEVLSSSVDDVLCRWCGHGRNVEVLQVGEEGSEGSGGDAPAGNDVGGTGSRSAVP